MQNKWKITENSMREIRSKLIWRHAYPEQGKKKKKVPQAALKKQD